MLAPSMEEIRGIGPEYLTDQSIYTIASMEQKQLERLRDATVEKVRAKMSDGVAADDLADVIESVRSSWYPTAHLLLSRQWWLTR